MPTDDVLESAAVLRDEVAEHRVRRARAAAGVPGQRTDRTVALPEPDREAYELQLDAYEVALAAYRSRLEKYALELEAAHHDGLTGTWLRQAGRRLLDAELQRAERAGEPMSIAFVDVDGLKTRNDRLGHAAGDAALTTVARVLMNGLRGYDHVIRWGGDEFLCVLPGVTHAEARARLRHTRHILAADPQELSISIGVAEWTGGESAEALVDRADRELYLQRGRDLRS